MPVRSPLAIAFAAVLASGIAVAPAQAKTLAFAGFTWEVRATGQGGPGPNHWNQANAWVDTAGALHLRLAPSSKTGVWQCAEVYLDQRLGFGTYQFEITGPIDQFDKNVVLGLFDYPTADVGPDGTNEIDVEFSHWGNAANPIGNFTVWPAVAGLEPGSHVFSFKLTDDRTTHRFAWSPTGVVFHSMKGFTDGNTPLLGQWTDRPASPTRQIPQNPLPVHMNLWLFQGHAPTNGQPVEIVVNAFRFTPM